jgi:1,2-diacylglycerol 3-alpha-glucosyltransferase
LNIGFFTDSYKPYMSGVVRSIELFTAELNRLGHQVYIFAPDYPEVERGGGIYRFKSLPVPTNPGYRLAIPFSKSVVRNVKGLGLDIIHSHTPFLMGWLARYLARKLDLPLAFTYHTLYEKYAHYAPVGKGLSRKFAVKYSKDYCQSCDLVIVPTEFVKDVLKGYNITSTVEIIATGINLLSYREKDGKWVREKYGITDNERVLLFVGRLGQEKNVTFLLKAFKEISDKLTDVKLMLVGDGPERRSLEMLSGELLIRDKVIFAGSQSPEGVVDYYLAGDLFVFPSVTETQGLVTLEAMAGGLPVVAVNAAGSRIMVDHEINGLLTKNELSSFTGAVVDLLTDKTRYQKMSKNALKKAEMFSITAMTEKLLTTYSNIISSRNEALQILA